MKKFRYQAINNQGNEVKGEVEADNEYAAAKLVKKRGLIVVDLKPGKNAIAGILPSVTNRVSQSEIAVMTRQLATMVNAGLPIVEALSILRMQSKPYLQSVFSQILADVEGGESLSVAMARHSKLFSPTYIALIKAGETGGVLDKVLNRLADNLEKQQEFRGKVKGAMIYPAIIVLGMLGVSVLMIVFVIPKLSELYDQFDAELPFATKMFIAISDIINNYWYLTLIAVIVIYLVFRAWKNTDSGKRKISEFVFKIPLIGPLQKQIILTEITRTLSLMVGSGVSILDSLTVVTGVVNNLVIKDALKDVQSQIEKGFPIAFAFAKHPDAFPYILSQMIAVGEETGKMEEVLAKVSHIFEVDSEQKVKALTSAIEPIIMVILGVGVAILVITIIMPIYNLTTAI